MAFTSTVNVTRQRVAVETVEIEIEHEKEHLSDEELQSIVEKKCKEEHLNWVEIGETYDDELVIELEETTITEKE